MYLVNVREVENFPQFVMGTSKLCNGVMMEHAVDGNRELGSPGYVN